MKNLFIAIAVSAVQWTVACSLATAGQFGDQPMEYRQSPPQYGNDYGRGPRYGEYYYNNNSVNRECKRWNNYGNTAVCAEW